ncbi:MAG: UvrD-helicase domain-containing protein [Alphaproteobacteria bacterium]|jgi:DNA helicase-2/ATP-dependent DNA helicase PcrA|nr:UvrD-helicase domain-containing protein [Alphaproteobacteria bacterium]
MADLFSQADGAGGPQARPGPSVAPASAPAPPGATTVDAPYLEGLNAPQREAVEALDGPVLVLAGAGTGKTRVLTTRLAHLLRTRRAWPSQVLAVTFTNKAAREMRERVAGLLGEPVEGWWLGTFHALAARMLRRHAERVGLTPNFTILDTDDQQRLIKQVMEGANLDARRWPARQLLGVIERWKDRGLPPGKLNAEDAGDIAGGRLLEIYRSYQERLRTLNACDFGDLLLHSLTLLQSDAEVLEGWHRKFRYILVDEYQDTNVAQYLWLRLLAQRSRNLCCVGDDDQSIYSWRGAEVGNILRFESDFPDAKVIRLEQNYRSTTHILSAASGLIANNRGRLGKTLFTAAEGGQPIAVRHVWDSEEEARWIGEEVEALQRAGEKLAQMAVLVRAGFQMRGFEERFLAIGLPYQVIGGPRFYERQEIRDALAYLRVIASPADDLAFERIVNVPKRGLGSASLQAVHRMARAAGVPLTEAAARIVETDELKPRARNALRALMHDFARWRDQAADIRHPDLARVVLDESGYTAMWQADKSPEATGRLDNLKEFVTGMEEFETLEGFLEHVSLVTSADGNKDGDRLTLMTLHAAKGLEFDHVFLPGWEEGLFPHQRAMDESGVAGLEEERRLAYVGLTRARRRAWICTAANRRVHGLWQSSLPSRFLGELPEAHVDLSDETGPSGRRDPGFAGPWGAGAGRPPGGAAGGRGEAGGFALPMPRGGFHRKSEPVIEGVAYTTERPAPAQVFAVGDRVFHQKFGPGTVRAAEGDKLTIAFDKAGEKKVISSFLTRESDAC